MNRTIAFALFIVLLTPSTPLSAQRQRSGGWVFGGAFGLTTSPPAAFESAAFDASLDRPTFSGSCAPNVLPSFGLLVGRHAARWLRTDLAVAANINSGNCDYAVINAATASGYATVQYIGKSVGYDHFTIVLRGVVERQPLTSSQLRLIAGLGCICEKRVPIAQIGAGITAGSHKARFTLEAGGQFSRIPWTRRVTSFAPVMEWMETGTSFPAQIWFRIGFEGSPSASVTDSH